MVAVGNEFGKLEPHGDNRRSPKITPYWTIELRPITEPVLVNTFRSKLLTLLAIINEPMSPIGDEKIERLTTSVFPYRS
jgi:hypothetical protein